MCNLYVISIFTPRPGKRRPVESRYGVVAASKEDARAKFLELYPAQITDTDVVHINKHEDGVCQIL